MVGQAGHVVLVDANVWASRTLRDWLCLIALHSPGVSTCRWTEDILAETLHASRRRNPAADGGAIATVREQIIGTFPDGQVRDYPIADDHLMGDALDAHVKAAAGACGADMIVTDNIKDFLPGRQHERDALDYEVYSADEFLVLVDDSYPSAVRKALTANLAYHWGKHGESTDIIGPLRAAGALEFAARVRMRCQEVSWPTSPPDSR